MPATGGAAEDAEDLAWFSFGAEGVRHHRGKFGRLVGLDAEAAGSALAGSGLALMAQFVSVDGGYLIILPDILAMGIGMGLSMTPATEAITGSLPREQQGVASALNDVTREFGTALGVALLGALLSAGYRDAIDDRLHDDIPGPLAGTAREGIANAVEAAAGAGSHAPDLIHAAQLSFVDGWQQAMWAGVAVMGALFAYITLRGIGGSITDRGDELN
ncbi:hypothetical protein ACIRRA_03135 [Nocardia sp. NPDC101769]|uniref:hypothetical protein n=1 Tax=Nocardia sp. NPDC101769 TaxID=3364333 RepID=UPI003817523F